MNTNYYVQKMFGVNSRTDLLPAQLNGKAVTGQNGLYVSSVWDDKTNEIIIKVVSK